LLRDAHVPYPLPAQFVGVSNQRLLQRRSNVFVSPATAPLTPQDIGHADSARPPNLASFSVNPRAAFEIHHTLHGVSLPRLPPSDSCLGDSLDLAAALGAVAAPQAHVEHFASAAVIAASTRRLPTLAELTTAVWLVVAVASVGTPDQVPANADANVPVPTTVPAALEPIEPADHAVPGNDPLRTALQTLPLRARHCGLAMLRRVCASFAYPQRATGPDATIIPVLDRALDSAYEAIFSSVLTATTRLLPTPSPASNPSCISNSGTKRASRHTPETLRLAIPAVTAELRATCRLIQTVFRSIDSSPFPLDPALNPATVFDSSYVTAILPAAVALLAVLALSETPPGASPALVAKPTDTLLVSLAVKAPPGNELQKHTTLAAYASAGRRRSLRPRAFRQPLPLALATAHPFLLPQSGFAALAPVKRFFLPPEPRAPHPADTLPTLAVQFAPASDQSSAAFRNILGHGHAAFLTNDGIDAVCAAYKHYEPAPDARVFAPAADQPSGAVALHLACRSARKLAHRAVVSNPRRAVHAEATQRRTLELFVPLDSATAQPSFVASAARLAVHSTSGQGPVALPVSHAHRALAAHFAAQCSLPLDDLLRFTARLVLLLRADRSRQHFNTFLPAAVAALHARAGREDLDAPDPADLEPPTPWEFCAEYGFPTAGLRPSLA
jgi:hypothetical protein